MKKNEIYKEFDKKLNTFYKRTKLERTRKNDEAVKALVLGVVDITKREIVKKIREL